MVAWSDLLGDFKLGAGVNFGFIHPYTRGLSDPRDLFQPKQFSDPKTVCHSSDMCRKGEVLLPCVSNSGGY